MNWYKLYFKLKSIWYKLIGVEFSGKVSVEEMGLNPEFSNYSSSSGNVYLHKVFKQMDISGNDSILDIGCGKGGAMSVMTMFPFQKISGIELSSEICQIARNNFAKLGLSSIELHNVDATLFDKYEDFNYFYMFNPFPCVTMERAIKLIEASLEKAPRQIHILYYNPECHEVLLKSKRMEIVERFPMSNSKSLFYYRSI